MNELFPKSSPKKQVKRWSANDEDFLFKNWNVLPMSDLCNRLGRNERAINLYLYRHRNDPRLVTKDNLLLRILRLQFVKPEYFTPDRYFYDTVKIGQKRFQAIYKGIEIMTDEECKRICLFFNILFEAVSNIRQLSFLDNPIIEQENKNIELIEDPNQLNFFDKKIIYEPTNPSGYN